MNDAISRQAVIDDLKIYVKLADSNMQWHTRDEFLGAIDDIENLPSAPQWIPVSKRLPDDGRTVLVTDWGETDFGRRHDGRWWNCDGDVLKDVSAWMPLPEPYKEGD